MPHTFVIDTQAARQRAMQALAKVPFGIVMTLRERRRTTEQSDRMWAMLSDVSRQCKIAGQSYPSETWKAVVMHECGHRPKVVPSLSGDGVVITGYRSSRLRVSEMSDVIEYLFSYGAENGVQWSNEQEAAA